MAEDTIKMDIDVKGNEDWPLKVDQPEGVELKRGSIVTLPHDSRKFKITLKRAGHIWLRPVEDTIPEPVEVKPDAPVKTMETDAGEKKGPSLEETKHDLEAAPIQPKEGSGRPVLVGVDGSPAAFKATWWAANYAKHSGLSLQIICAYSLPSYAAVSFDSTYSGLGDDYAANSDAQGILAKAKAIAIEQGLEDNRIQTLVVTGDPSSVFVELSRNYDLIVVGNRGKGGLAERLLGTTSSTLPAYAYCPVIVVPYTTDDGEVVNLDSSIRKIVAGVDDTPWGVRALDIAADLAQGWSAELTIVSAAPAKINDNEKMIYKGELEEQVDRIKSTHPGLNIVSKLVTGTAKKALLDEDASTDVVVVGSRGRGGLTGLLLGSTSQDLIHHSSKPVYVVPKKFVDPHIWKRERETIWGADVDRYDNVFAAPVDPAPEDKVEDVHREIDPKD